MEQYFWCFENWKLSQKPGSIGLGYNHSHLTDSTAAILGNHERGVQAGSQLKLQCRILKILQPHEKPPFDKTMKWLHNGQKVSNCTCVYRVSNQVWHICITNQKSKARFLIPNLLAHPVIQLLWLTTSKTFTVALLLSNCPRKKAKLSGHSPRNCHRNNVFETWRFLCAFCFPAFFCYWDDRLFFFEKKSAAYLSGRTFL